VLNRVESTDYTRTKTVVYTQEYPITRPMVGIGPMSMLNARCLPIQPFVFTYIYIYGQVPLQFNPHSQSVKYMGSKLSSNKIPNFKCKYIEWLQRNPFVLFEIPWLLL